MGAFDRLFRARKTRNEQERQLVTALGEAEVRLVLVRQYGPDEEIDPATSEAGQARLALNVFQSMMMW